MVRFVRKRKDHKKMNHSQHDDAAQEATSDTQQNDAPEPSQPEAAQAEAAAGQLSGADTATPSTADEAAAGTKGGTKARGKAGGRRRPRSSAPSPSDDAGESEREIAAASGAAVADVSAQDGVSPVDQAGQEDNMDLKDALHVSSKLDTGGEAPLHLAGTDPDFIESEEPVGFVRPEGVDLGDREPADSTGEGETAAPGGAGPMQRAVRRTTGRRRTRPVQRSTGDAAASGTNGDEASASAEPATEGEESAPGRSAGSRGTRRRASSTQRPSSSPSRSRTRRTRSSDGEQRTGRTSSRSESSDRARAEADDRQRGQMLVHADGDKIQIAILEGRSLVEHYVTHRWAQSIAGNIYLGKVQNVLPGMEAAFIDIGTPKNAVLYAGDVRFLPEEPGGNSPRIEDILEVGMSVLVQVVKDPMGSKGARLTTEISLPGRFLVLVPESESTGISRRLPESERERLRDTLRRIRPDGFGIIVRTAAEETTEDQLKVDLDRLEHLWHEIYRTSNKANPPALVYEEPELVIRTVREIFSSDFRRLIVDDKEVYDRIVGYLSQYESDLVKKVSFYEDELSIFKRYHVHDQLKQGLSRKVWLPSGGSLVFDRGEALTVIDVNTSKNVGKSSLEETVYQNNLEAAEEIALQLRLRDIGGIIVIDFIDMEIRKNRDGVLRAFRQAVSKDKTKTQVYDISDLGLVEMTRKNVSEGLLETFSHPCTECGGRGVLIDEDLLS